MNYKIYWMLENNKMMGIIININNNKSYNNKIKDLKNNQKLLQIQIWKLVKLRGEQQRLRKRKRRGQSQLLKAQINQNNMINNKENLL